MKDYLNPPARYQENYFEYIILEILEDGTTRPIRKMCDDELNLSPGQKQRKNRKLHYCQEEPLMSYDGSSYTLSAGWIIEDATLKKAEKNK